MRNKLGKQSAFMDIKDERGMTFISMLLTFVIIVMTLPFVVYVLNNIQPTTFQEDMAVQQFFLFLRNDALEAKQVYSENNTLYFYLNANETAKIEMYANLIRRQVNGTGHEIYLRNIASFKVDSLSYGAKVVVTTTKGETYEKTIAYYNE